MTAYQWLLLDADNTLFDFDAAEEFALGRLFCHYVLADTPELRAGYRAINSALWAAFDRGEIGTPRSGTNFTSTPWPTALPFSPGRRGCAGGWPSAIPWPLSPTAWPLSSADG